VLLGGGRNVTFGPATDRNVTKSSADTTNVTFGPATDRNVTKSSADTTNVTFGPVGWP